MTIEDVISNFARGHTSISAKRSPYQRFLATSGEHCSEFRGTNAGIFLRVSLLRVIPFCRRIVRDTDHLTNYTNGDIEVRQPGVGLFDTLIQNRSPMREPIFLRRKLGDDVTHTTYIPSPDHNDKGRT